MFAPILVSVYNRKRHLEMCIDSLKSNPCSTQTDLYVVSDAAQSREFESDIESIRRYITSIDGFKNVFPIFRENNIGSFLSIKNAIDDVLEKHGRVIFIEDDNIVSDNFLRFINEGLDFYNDDPSVFSICGYNHPVAIPKEYPHDIFKWQGFAGWGVGLWHSKWKTVDWNRTWIDSFLSDKTKVRALNNIGEHVLAFQAEMKNKNKIYSDVLISIHLVNHNLFSIFPVVSTVRNTGLDGTGEHCELAAEIYTKQIIDSYRDYKWIKDIAPSPQINMILSCFFRMPLKAKIKRIIPKPIKDILKSILF